MKPKHLTIYYLVLALALGLYWFFALFPFNLRDPGFVVLLILLSALVVAPFVLKLSAPQVTRTDGVPDLGITLKQGSRILLLPLVLVVLFVVGIVSGFLPVRSRAYAGLIDMPPGDFTEDIAEIEFYDIPTIDRETAIRLGNRQMGEMAHLVSQFDVALDYTQTNFQDDPVRVTPLAYDGFFKWLNNRSAGIPNLIMVDLVTGEVDLLPVEGGMKYSESEPLFRNIHRHVRFRYPTAILGDAKFEVDESAVPHWIFPVLQPQVGWFGGKDVESVIIVNAVTGESQRYDTGEIPQWVDRAYPSEMIMEQLDYHGMYQDGWFNSFIGQRGVLQVTAGYNYLALNDDVYLYTGITSVSGDASNLGFILVNLRTKQSSYYAVSSADETSAMRSAEGAVQEKGYISTFPILLNINGRPTYCMALKDNAQLVKSYALVDAQNYQTVATGPTIQGALVSYEGLLATQLMQGDREAAEGEEALVVNGVVEAVSQVVVEGNTVFYFMLEDSDVIYAAPVTLNPTLPFVEAGATVRIEYRESQGSDTLRVADQLELR